MSTSKFPKVQGGGSLILAWQARNKHILVIGGGEVAAGRILNVLNADARVTVICPSSGLNSEVQHRITQGQVQHIDRNFEASHLDNKDDNNDNDNSSSNSNSNADRIDMVLCAVDDPIASSQVYVECRRRRIPANIADVPAECDFYFGSTHRDGPLQIMVSTNGNGPRMAALVRRWIAKSLPPNCGAAIVKVGALRKKLRRLAPEQSESAKRMQWMSKVCDDWSLDDLSEIDDADMEMLLKYYEPGTVPSLVDLRTGKEPGVAEFDGSFGWWI